MREELTDLQRRVLNNRAYGIISLGSSNVPCPGGECWECKYPVRSGTVYTMLCLTGLFCSERCGVEWIKNSVEKNQSEWEKQLVITEEIQEKEKQERAKKEEHEKQVKDRVTHQTSRCNWRCWFGHHFREVRCTDPDWFRDPHRLLQCLRSGTYYEEEYSEFGKRPIVRIGD